MLAPTSDHAGGFFLRCTMPPIYVVALVSKGECGRGDRYCEVVQRSRLAGSSFARCQMILPIKTSGYRLQGRSTGLGDATIEQGG